MGLLGRFGGTVAEVYSPVDTDFSTELVAPLTRDPVVIARSRLGSEAHYFEVARWDISRDLAAMYSAVTR